MDLKTFPERYRIYPNKTYVYTDERYNHLIVDSFVEVDHKFNTYLSRHRNTIEKWQDTEGENNSLSYEQSMYRHYKDVPEKEIVPVSRIRGMLQMSLGVYDLMIRNSIPCFRLEGLTSYYVKMDEVNHYLLSRRVCINKKTPYRLIHKDEVFLRPTELRDYFSIDKIDYQLFYRTGLPVYLFIPFSGTITKTAKFKYAIKRYRYSDIIDWITQKGLNVKLPNIPEIVKKVRFGYDYKIGKRRNNQSYYY